MKTLKPTYTALSCATATGVIETLTSLLEHMPLFGQLCDGVTLSEHCQTAGPELRFESMVEDSMVEDLCREYSTAELQEILCYVYPLKTAKCDSFELGFTSAGLTQVLKKVQKRGTDWCLFTDCNRVGRAAILRVAILQVVPDLMKHQRFTKFLSTIRSDVEACVKEHLLEQEARRKNAKENLALASQRAASIQEAAAAGDVAKVQQLIQSLNQLIK